MNRMGVLLVPLGLVGGCLCWNWNFPNLTAYPKRFTGSLCVHLFDWINIALPLCCNKAAVGLVGSIAVSGSLNRW